jgi:hypothetical protein
MPKPHLMALSATLVMLAGCGSQGPVVHSIEGSSTGKLVDVPLGYGIKCPAAMLARGSGSEGTGVAGIWASTDGVQLASAVLRFGDVESARRAYAASVSPQTQRCYAQGVTAELVRQYGIKVRRAQTRPVQFDSTTNDEESRSRLSIVVAVGGHDVTVSIESSTVRTDTTLGLNEDIDMTALGRRGLAPWLVPAVSG